MSIKRSVLYTAAAVLFAVSVGVLLFSEDLTSLLHLPPATDVSARKERQERDAANNLNARISLITDIMDRDPVEAIGRAHDLLSGTDSIRTPRPRGRILRLLAVLYRESGILDTATMFAERSLQEALMLEDPALIAASHILRGTIRFERGRMDSALADYDEALRMINPAKDSLLLAQVYSNRANVLSRRGEFAQSTSDYLTAAHIFEALDMGNTLSVLYDNLADDNSRWGNYTRAIRYYRKAIAINRRVRNLSGLAGNYANLGVTYKEMGRLDRALQSYDSSLVLARRLGNRIQIAQNLLNMGNIFLQLGEQELAAQVFDSSLHICREDSLQYGILANNVGLGQLYTARKRYGLAESHLRTGLRLATAMALPEERAEIYQSMVTLFSARGDYRSALAMEQQYQVLHDSLFNRETQQSFQELQIRYETEKKDAENRQLRAQNRIHELDLQRRNIIIASISGAVLIALALIVFLYISRRRKIAMLALLEEKNRIIENKSEALAESNGIKELLLDIVTHDLANPAATIAGGLSLLRTDAVDTDIIDILGKSSARLNNVLENARALTHVTMYENFPKELLELRPLLAEVLSEFSHVMQECGMEVSIRVEDDLFIHANPVIGEVFKNFVSNTVKYARSGQYLEIEAYRSNGHTTVIFSDRGETIPQQHRRSIFHRSVQLSQKWNRGHGIGLAIVARIVEAHGGEVWVDANEPTGNRFCVRLPFAKTDASLNDR